MILQKLVAIRVTGKSLITALYLSGSRSETASVTSVSILGSEGLETTHPRPAKAGPAESEDRWGSLKGIGRYYPNPNPILFAGAKSFPKAKARSAKAESECSFLSCKL